MNEKFAKKLEVIMNNVVLSGSTLQSKTVAAEQALMLMLEFYVEHKKMKAEELLNKSSVNV
jgi:hypothetical protein